MEQMYKGIPFSPTATLTANIGAADTIIPVSDIGAFPDAPNIATIGSIAGPNETIIYTGKTTTSLTGCTRGVEGTASDWAVDELIGRNFTAKDHADMVKNIEELDSKKLDATYKVDVVNTEDATIAGKALDARQNNPNITGTLAQKVTSNTQQINVLNESTFMKSQCQQYYKGAYITDWDNVIENGLYMSDSAANAPYGNSIWFEVQVIAHDTNYITQIAYMFANTPIKVFKRNCVNGAWQPWSFYSYTDSLPLSLQSGWSNVANTNSLVLINAPSVSIIGRVKGGSIAQYSNIAVFPFYMSSDVGQLIVQLYNLNGSVVGSAIAVGNTLQLVSITDNSDVNFNFSIPISV